MIALASHPCGPGLIPDWPVAICGLSLLLVLYSAPTSFSQGSPVSPFSSKTNISKFQFDRIQDIPENHFRVSGASWANITNYYYNFQSTSIRILPFFFSAALEYLTQLIHRMGRCTAITLVDIYFYTHCMPTEVISIERSSKKISS